MRHGEVDTEEWFGWRVEWGDEMVEVVLYTCGGLEDCGRNVCGLYRQEQLLVDRGRLAGPGKRRTRATEGHHMFRRSTAKKLSRS